MYALCKKWQGVSVYDIFEEIAALLHRLPPAPTCPDSASDQLTPEIRRKRETEARMLAEEHQEEGSDPLLSKIRELAHLKREIDEQLSLLIVYSRHFVPPRPYQLSLVADAAGLSVSGVRAISSRKREMEEIVRNLERSDIKGIVTPRSVNLEQSLANLETLTSKKRWRTVVYRLAGTASSADVTLNGATGPQTFTSVQLPVDKSYSIPPGARVQVSLKNRTTEGSVSCEIVVDGTPVGRDEADGPYAVASCAGTVP
jgi:hypothetical protein